MPDTSVPSDLADHSRRFVRELSAATAVVLLLGLARLAQATAPAAPPSTVSVRAGAAARPAPVPR